MYEMKRRHHGARGASALQNLAQTLAVPPFPHRPRTLSRQSSALAKNAEPKSPLRFPQSGSTPPDHPLRPWNSEINTLPGLHPSRSCRLESQSPTRPPGVRNHAAITRVCRRRTSPWRQPLGAPPVFH
jgi:hypothetical protein